jgi:hypothetical protein
MGKLALILVLLAGSCHGLKPHILNFVIWSK